MLFIKKRKQPNNSLLNELSRLLEIVERGFYYDSKPLDRLAAASALGRMKTILRNMSEPPSYKGTQAEDLEKLMAGKKAN